MITREEEYWSSFRSAVVDFQHSFVAATATAHAGAPNKSVKRPSSRNGNGRSPVDADHNSSSERETQQSALDAKFDTREDTTEPQPKHNSENDAGSSSEDLHYRWGESSDANTSHQRLELIGIEEVNRGENNRSMNIENNDIMTPPNARSHTSHTTTAALSMAERQLAETRLKLHMTEAARDELEFQLMQK